MCCRAQTWVRARGIIQLRVVSSNHFIYRLSDSPARVFPTVFMCIYLFPWFYSFSLLKYLIKLWFSWCYSELKMKVEGCMSGSGFSQTLFVPDKGEGERKRRERSRQWDVHLCAFGQLSTVMLCMQSAGIARPFTSAVKYLFARWGRK